MGREDYNTGSDELHIQICVWQQPVQDAFEKTVWILLMDNYEIICLSGKLVFNVFHLSRNNTFYIA